MNSIETRFAITVRPLSHAFFIPEESFACLRDAIRICSTQWGGFFNLIIPLGLNTTIRSEFIRLLVSHEPDRAVLFRDSMEEKGDQATRLRSELARILPTRNIEVHAGADYVNEDPSVHIASMLPPNQFARILNQWSFDGLDPSDAAILAATTGEIPREQNELFTVRIGTSLASLDIASAIPWELQLDQDPFRSPINLTTAGIRPYRTENTLRRCNFDVVVTNSVVGICAYWCFRAVRQLTDPTPSGRRILLCPPRVLIEDERLAALANLVRSAGPAPGRTCTVDVSWWSDRLDLKRQLNERNLEPFGMELFGGEKITYTSFRGSRIQRESDDKRIIQCVCGIPRTGKVVSYGLGPSPLKTPVLLQERANEVLFEPPEDLNDLSGGGVVLDWDVEYWSRFPHHDVVAKLMDPNAWWGRGGVSAIYSPDTRPQYLSINLPSDIQVLQVWFKNYGYEARISQSGKYGSGLLAVLGNMRPLAAFADPLALKVCEQLVVGSVKKIAQRLKHELPVHDEDVLLRALSEIGTHPLVGRGGKSLNDLASSIGQSKSLILSCLSALAKYGLIRRGFTLQCPRCSSWDWHPLGAVNETVTCPGCRNQFDLAMCASEGVELQWKYLLNSLLERVMDQDVLPSLLALRHLVGTRAVYLAVPGVELIKDGRAVCDIDYILIMDNKVSGGECKAGCMLSAKDIEIARIASECDFAEFHFCTTQEFADPALQLIEEIRSELAPKTRIESLQSSVLLRAE